MHGPPRGGTGTDASDRTNNITQYLCTELILWELLAVHPEFTHRQKNYISCNIQCDGYAGRWSYCSFKCHNVNFDLRSTDSIGTASLENTT